MIVATAIYCSLSILLFPCVVSLGRRYEKRRGMLVADDERHEMAVDDIQAGDEESGVEESRVQVTQQANNKKSNLPRAGSWSSSSFDVSDKSQSSSNADRRKNDDQDQGPSSYVRGGFTAPAGDNKTKLQVPVLIDNVLVPPYQDDGGINLDIANHGDGITPLDTGAGFRHRHAGARRYRRGQKDQRWEREQEQERRLSLIARGELDARDSTFEESSGDSPAIGLSDERYSTLDPSLLMASNRSYEGSRSASSNQPYLRRTDLRSSIEKQSSMSSIQRSSLSGSSGIMPEDAIDANDPGQIPLEKVPMEGEELDLCCGDHAWWKPVHDCLLHLTDYLILRNGTEKRREFSVSLSPFHSRQCCRDYSSPFALDLSHTSSAQMLLLHTPLWLLILGLRKNSSEALRLRLHLYVPMLSDDKTTNWPENTSRSASSFILCLYSKRTGVDVFHREILFVYLASTKRLFRWRKRMLDFTSLHSMV